MCLAFHLTRIKELILEAMQFITEKHTQTALITSRAYRGELLGERCRTCGYKIWIRMIMTLRQT